MQALQEQIVRPVWRGSGPFIVWALHFFGLYVLVAAGCTAGWAEAPLLGTSVLRVLLLAASVLALGCIGWMLWRADGGRPRGTRGLLAVAAAGSAWLALIAVAWASVPALMLPMCLPGGP
jgi:hypothetical protein